MKKYFILALILLAGIMIFASFVTVQFTTQQCCCGTGYTYLTNSTKTISIMPYTTNMNLLLH